MGKGSVEVLFNLSGVKVDFDSETTTIEAINKLIKHMWYPIIRSRA